MPKRFIISSGVGGVAPIRERVNSATVAMELALSLMRLRRPNVTIEDEWGSPVSFFELKDEVASESRQENAERA
jgi:hypothetical protein